MRSNSASAPWIQQFEKFGTGENASRVFVEALQHAEWAAVWVLSQFGEPLALGRTLLAAARLRN